MDEIISYKIEKKEVRNMEVGVPEEKENRRSYPRLSFHEQVECFYLSGDSRWIYYQSRIKNLCRTGALMEVEGGIPVSSIVFISAKKEMIERYLANARMVAVYPGTFVGKIIRNEYVPEEKMFICGVEFISEEMKKRKDVYFAIKDFLTSKGPLPLSPSPNKKKNFDSPNKGREEN